MKKQYVMCFIFMFFSSSYGGITKTEALSSCLGTLKAQQGEIYELQNQYISLLDISLIDKKKVKKKLKNPNKAK